MDDEKPKVKTFLELRGLIDNEIIGSNKRLNLNPWENQTTDQTLSKSELIDNLNKEKEKRKFYLSRNRSDDIKKYFPFLEFRNNQEEAITRILDAYYSGKRFFILEAPTGAGKSVIAYTVGKYILDHIGRDERKNTKCPAIVACTSTKQLQLQYSNTFLDMANLWGAANYECLLDRIRSGIDLNNIINNDNDSMYYGTPDCMKQSCVHYSDCEYVLAKSKFMKAKLGILNYDYFLNAKSFVPIFNVMDEAHNLEDKLCRTLTVTFNKFTIENIFKSANKLGIDTATTKFVRSLIGDLFSITDLTSISDIMKVQNLLDECKILYDRTALLIKDMQAEITNEIPDHLYNNYRKLGKINRFCENSMEKINRFIDSETDWIISIKEKEKLQFKPLKIHEISSDVFNRSNLFLMMSATICGAEAFCKDLGIPQDSFEFLSMPATIPVENRRIMTINGGSMGKRHKKKTFPKLVEYLDTFIKKINKTKGKVRGIIHSVSYDNAKYIMDHTEYKNRMFLPKGDDYLQLEDILNECCDIILISPRITEGVDLAGDLSRFQFFIKVPYPYLGDNWVKAKQMADQKWYNRQTIIKIVQGCGRSVRGEDDWAWTFILDSDFRRLIDMNGEMFPVWFKEAIFYVNIQSDD